MNVPPSYNRDTHETAVRWTLAKAAGKRDVGLLCMCIFGISSLAAVAQRDWIILAIWIALFAWQYHVWKVNKSVVKHILGGSFDYPSPVVEKAFLKEQEVTADDHDKE